MAVLLRGVTAVRDLAWPAERIFPLADASETPSFSGPLIRAAGPMLTAPGGYPTADRWAPAGTGRELHGPEDAAAAVRDLAARGAAAIKVSLNAEAGPTPSDAELAAVADAAGAAGIPVTAHAQGAGQVERALGAGFDELAHTPWTHRLSDDVIATAAQRLRIVSTLDICSFGRDTPEIRTALENLRRFHTAGGTVIYGTDLGNGAIPPGIHTRELRLMVEAGMEYEEVLEALVRAPIEPGAPADLLVLTGSPLDDLEAFDEIRAVIRAGRVVTLR
jgi:imidazolonepropionase-like amidohydrolase